MPARSIVLVIVVFALLLLPGTVLAQGTTPAASPAADLTFEGPVDAGGGRTLHLACAGTGGPPVLFEWGGPNVDGAASAIMAELGPGVAAALGTRFCAYDRAGTSQSPPDAAEIRTLREAAADLNAVLRSPQLGCPCVVVGNSLGGAIAQASLAADARGFGGLILLDAIYPDYFDDYIAIAPGDASATAQWLDLARGNNPERLDFVSNLPSLVTPARPPAIPIVVVSHGAGEPPPCQGGACAAGFPVDALETAWQAGQVALAEALGGQLVVAEGTGHSIADENPELVLGLATEMIAALRDPQ